MQSGGAGVEAGGAALHATPPAPSARHHAPVVAVLTALTHCQPPRVCWYCSSWPAPEQAGGSSTRTASSCACRIARLNGGGGGGGGCAATTTTASTSNARCTRTREACMARMGA
jgi:hypothetical protein